jgi:polyhydroxyalkanoate synthesis repressor PhaR
LRYDFELHPVAPTAMARRIKRYNNRKLYDTESSEYVSLSDIAELVRSGETVKVVDNATDEDLTAQTLTQIILEEGKNGQTVIPSELLHQILRRSEEMVDTGIDQIRSTVDDLVQNSVGRLRQLVQSPRAQELDELRTQLRELEHRLSILLDNLDEESKEALSAPPEETEPVSQDGGTSS